MADGKRKPMILEHNAAADDEADLLVHLDEARQREHNAWNQKRCRAVRQHVAADGLEGGSESDERLDGGGATRDDQTATQIFSSALLHCRRRLQRDEAAHESLGTANATVVVREADVVEDDGDMLLHLRDERKRELNQISQRRFHARRREELLNALRNEGTLNPLLRLRVERDKELNRNRQRRFTAKRRQQLLDAQFDGDDADREQELNGEKKNELDRSGQRRSRAKRRLESSDAPVHDTFDNELSSKERFECLERLRKALGAEGLDECVCVSCDRLVLRQDSRRVEDTDSSYLHKMQNQLSVNTADIPQMLVDMYRPPTHLTMLAGASVSPRGIHSYTGDDSSLRSWMSVCNECDRSIQKGKLPKFAIGNGFFVGYLPTELRGLTLPERLMTQLVQLAAITRVMRGGRHRCIRSHCIAFDCTPGPPVSLLPREIHDVASYRVVMAGEFTPAQAVQARKLHRIRSQQVQSVFAFYMKNNYLYAGVAANASALNRDYTEEDAERVFLEHVDDPGDNLDDEINREQESIRGESDAWRVMHPQDEISVIERRIGLAINEVPVAAREHLVIPATVNKERSFEIRRSNQIASDVSDTLLARMFPHLFPFGRGHPGEHRKINVSVEECVKHYTLLSERRFSVDELFSLVAFDRISLRNMFITNHYRCQRFPHLLDGYETLSAERLGRALLQNERRRQGCLPWRPNDDSVAQRFLKSVEVGSRSVWGSNAERAQCRQQAFAYQARFGQPALFVTLTPNTDNSQVLAQYTGILSVDTLFDLLGSRLPSKADIREASRGNDCASARLFMRSVDAFIRYALGIDPATRKQLSFRGLFGDVKAYFGMVETQGRGTLHVHFLIWLNKCPSNSTSVENILKSPDGDRFRERVSSYATSVVRNDLPIRLGACCCSSCGASFSQLKALSIPEAARKDPHTASRPTRFRCTAAEPLLVECSLCGMQCSSQHLIRSALLKFRPKHWPLWRYPLTTGEIEKQAATEGVCRDTKECATRIVSERESIYASFCDEELTHESDAVTVELLHQANHRQQPMCKSDDDPFRNDDLTRLLELSPPSSSDARMPKEAQDYMVSALAVLLNQHLWSHTKSCFKTSGVTCNDSFCRYRFPRDRVDKTSFESAGVELKRTLGHEYMNGFNYEIMAAFKCNHDIQVLLGGSDVTDRIHYCCKYVTKQQNQLNSQVAVAMAALNRRQEREHAEVAIGGVMASDRLGTARKRITALVYNMTNRQEIAGPLAALYLYRESCCFSSAKCATLPVGDVIRQLTMSEDYSCSLVADNDALGAANFRAVSSLDDYIFRPNVLEAVNLYAFTMRYFRKKSERMTSSALRFMGAHPLSHTHCLGERYDEVVPIIQGFRMPDTEANATDEQKSKFSVLSLVLFKPFRGLDNLIGDSDCSDEQAWVDRFEQWKPTRSKFVEEIMNNMNDFYSGRVKVKAQREHVPLTEESGEAEGSCSVDNDELFRATCDGPDGELFDAANNGADDRELCRLWEMEEATDVILESSSVDPGACPTSASPDSRIASMIAIINEQRMLQSSTEMLARQGHTAFPTTGLPAVDTMKKWVKSSDTDNALRSTAQCAAILPRNTEVVELLDNALLAANMTWRPTASVAGEPKISKRFSCIAEVSYLYTLNERQHFAFKAIAQALLTRWRRAEVPDPLGVSLDTKLSDGQLLMYLGGVGGTGKSRIVAAVQAICESWGRPHSVIKTALTGKAATIIGGRTLAGFLLQMQKRKVCEMIAELELIFIDEVSMMRKYQLAQLDKRLRIAKRVPGVAFGGAHIVLVGDFLQLPPVGGEPIYKDPTQKAKVSTNELAGYQLWRQFEDVIVLKESVRFQNDPEWGRGCQEARLGIWTPEFVSLVNSRVITSENPFQEPNGLHTVGTFVTPDNATRAAINNLFIAAAAQRLPEGEFPVRVVADFKGKLDALRRSEVRAIMQLPDTKFGRLAPYLDLIIGMPIQVTQNIRAAKLVANGTLGRLEAIIYHPDTTFRLVHDSTSGMTVKVPSLPPPAVIVRIRRGPGAVAMVGCHDADLFPLFFDSKAYSPCDIPLAGCINGVPRSLNARVEQFPLVCAVSSTVYKVQGDTLDSMVVTEWRSKGAIANKREQPYLLVSRVTSRLAFATLEPLTNEITSWAHPSRAAVDEEARLERLSDSTIERLRAN